MSVSSDVSDERTMRADAYQRAAAKASGAGIVSESLGGSAFSQQILAKSTNLRHNDTAEWADVQKAAFTDWINSTLRERGMRVQEDLFAELVDGTILYNLLEVLSGESLAEYGRLTQGKMRIQLIANCSIAFKYLSRHVKIVDIGPTDIVDSNPKRVLGLIWAIFVYYEVLSIPDVKSVSDLKEKILAWARRRTRKYQGVNVTNLTSSFEDGKAVLALLHDANAHEAPYRPTSDAVLNRKKAYRLAEELYGVPQLLNYQDSRVFSYEQVMLTYLVELYNRLPKEIDRTLAMVMIYLKVFSWWRRVKSGHRTRQQEKQSSQQHDSAPVDPPIYASHPDPNEYVALLFVDGVRSLPKGAQVQRLVAECGRDSVSVQISVDNFAASIILHAATAVNDVALRILGPDDGTAYSTRIALPLPSAPHEPFHRAEWHSSAIGSGHIHASIVKLKFRDLARVASKFSEARTSGDSAKELERIIEKLESALVSTNNGQFKALPDGLDNGSLSYQADTLLGLIVDQAQEDERVRSNAEARLAQLERDNAALQKENQSLREQRARDSSAAFQSDELQAAMQLSETRMSDDRNAFERRLSEQQRTIDVLLKKEQVASDSLKVAQDDLATMRELTGGTGEGKDNKIYDLNRQITIANDLNKEHASALSIAAKKLVRLQDTLNVYRHTMQDVSRALGATLNGLLTSPMSRDELESMHSSALDTTPDAPDAVLTLRVSERIVTVMTQLDQEVQLALSDVAPSIRNLMKQIPLFEDGLVRHTRFIANINAETNRLVAVVEDACGGFENELSVIQPEER